MLLGRVRKRMIGGGQPYFFSILAKWLFIRYAGIPRKWKPVDTSMEHRNKKKRFELQSKYNKKVPSRVNGQDVHKIPTIF